MRWVILILLLLGAAFSQTTIPTASLPIPVSSALTAGEQALLASATSGGNCVPSTHVWCAGHDPGNTGFLNGQHFIIRDSNSLPQWPTTSYGGNPAISGAITALGSGTSTDGEVIVLDSMAQASGGYLGPGQWLIPFSSTPSYCIGNNVGSGAANCNFILPQIPQADPAHPKKLFIVTSHLSSFPPIGNLVIPNFSEVDGTGAFVPSNYRANIQPTDFARIYTGTVNGVVANGAFAALGVPQGADNVVFIGIEFTTTAENKPNPVMTNGDGSYTVLGSTSQLVVVNGGGGSGGRAIPINANGGSEQSIMTQAGVIIPLHPFIASCNYDTATGPPCASVLLDPGTTPATPNSAPVRRMYLLANPDTHMLQGQTVITFTWGGADITGTNYSPPLDGTNPAISIRPTLCADSTTSTPPHVCVTDSQHAFVDIVPFQPWTITTCTSSAKQCYNGGVYNFYLDTYPTGACPSAWPPQFYTPGGQWSACTEHIGNNDPILVAYDHTLKPQFTVTCPTCPNAPDGTPVIPTVPIRAWPITITGASGQTAWTVGSNTTQVGVGWGASMISSGTAVTSGAIGGVQTITGVSVTPTVFMPQPLPISVVIRNATANNSAQQAIGATPLNDIAELYRGLGLINAATYGIEYCGESKTVTHFWIRGQQYSFTCHGVGTHWTTIPNCTTDPCCDPSVPSSVECGRLNLGQDIDIMAHTAVNDTTMNITIFVCDGVTSHPGCTPNRSAESGAKNVWFVQNWFHGQSNQFFEAANPTVPCKPPVGDVVDTCFQKNTIAVQALLVQNAAGGVVRDSFFNDANWPQNIVQDTQAVGFTLGTGPCLIENNFIGAATEHVFNGGVGNIATHSPTSVWNCTVHNNHMMHPPIYHAWGLANLRPRMGYITSICIGTVCNGGTGKANTAYVTGSNNLIVNASLPSTISGLTNPALVFLNDHNYTVASPTTTSWQFALTHVDQAAISGTGIARQTSGAAANRIPPDNNYSATLNNKDHFELKAGSYFDFNGNIMDSNFTGSTSAYGTFVMTPRTGLSQGHSGAYTNDIIIRNNLVINQLQLISQEAEAAECNYGTGSAAYAACNMGSFPVSVHHRSVFWNNLMVPNLSETSPPAIYPPNVSFPPYPLKVGPFSRHMLMGHSTTWMATGKTTTAAGLYFNYAFKVCSQLQTNGGVYNLWFYNNIIFAGFGSNLGCPPSQWMVAQPTPNDLTKRMLGNVFSYTGVSSNGGIDTSKNANATAQNASPVFRAEVSNTYIMGSTFAGDYTLVDSSPSGQLAGWIGPSATNTTDGQTAGVDMATLISVLGNTFSGQASTSPSPPYISTTGLPSGQVGVAYSFTLAALGGVPPYTWAVTSGSVPGLSLAASTGLLSGTPTTAGTYSLTIAVTDSIPLTSSLKTFSVTVNPSGSAPVITTSSPLPAGTVGVAYSVGLAASGGVPPYSGWTITSGSVTGLSLNASTGLYSGTPSTAGTYSIAVTVHDSVPLTSAAKTFSITINPGPTPPTITTTSPLQGGVANVAYSSTFTASGGSPPYQNWTIASGNVPGLSLDPDSGIFSGVPLTAGAYNLSVTVQDSLLLTSTATSFLITIAPAGTNYQINMQGPIKVKGQVTIDP